MTVGSITITALAAAALATLVWGACKTLQPAREWLRILLFGLFLVLVVLAGPLIRLP